MDKYTCRYDLYSDGDVLINHYYFDSSDAFLLEENTDSALVDRYTYMGEFPAKESEFANS